MKLHENRCRQCKKLFCCLNCRLSHEHKKHTERELKCPLCCSKKLQIKGDESQDFICHLVFNHLPLLCRLCGKSFQTSDDLKTLHKCGWWRTENTQKVLKILGNTFVSIAPLMDIKTSLESCNNKETVSENRLSTDYVTFNSPPVLIRNTSTPMNVPISGPKSNFEFRSMNSLSFLLKTPKNLSPSLDEKESRPVFDNNELRRCCSDTQYNSGLYSQSRSSLQSSSFPQKSHNSTNPSDYYTCEQYQSESDKISGLMLRTKDLSESQTQNRRESIKKVRFSDQFPFSTDMNEDHEFFEARESFFEISLKGKNDATGSSLSLNSSVSSLEDSPHHENEINFERENQISMKENEVSLKKHQSSLKKDKVCMDETKTSSPKDKNCFHQNKQNDLSYDKSASPNSSNTIEQSGSSRVVMMVLVENATSLSRSELVPLIDSGLKQMEKTASAVGSIYSSLSSHSSEDDQFQSRESATRKRSITSVNSYFSVTSTECFTAESGSQRSLSENSSSGNVESSKSDGIFSAMARVVRSALRKLPGTSSLHEESTKDKIQELHSPVAKLPTLSIESKIDQPPNKRPRDPSSPPTMSTPTFPSDDRSPMAKRPRGWYKIKAREPIARMKKVQVTSPKGISSETQRFQQGSLSVGRQNTIIPLPSRAHQFTQTD